MKTTRTPDAKCPGCFAETGYATSVEGAFEPRPGDLTICAECHAALAFDDNMRLRTATPDEAWILRWRLPLPEGPTDE